MNIPHASLIAAPLIGAALTLSLSAQTLLIDFGNDVSFRGTNVVNPDSNGNFWNSVDSSVYWPNLVDINGTTTTVGFGFGTATNGTDSFNGPAGTNSDPALVEIDSVALGDLGIPAAVFDYYATATFTVQGLDPAKQYNLTFFGSRKFPQNTGTVYTVYTSNDYASAVGSATLDVCEPGAEWLHNSNRVAVIQNVSPQFADSLWIGYIGDAGNNGYLNAVLIEESPAGPGEVGITALPPGDGTVTVAFVGEDGVGYTLQFTSDLLDGNGWQTVLVGDTPVADTGDGVSTLNLNDPDPSDALRVYRLVESP